MLWSDELLSGKNGIIDVACPDCEFVSVREFRSIDGPHFKCLVCHHKVDVGHDALGYFMKSASVS
ncbi:hypothetical protein [Mycobacteroides abscessus]|uniref:hypothetical protein n=1 Tax=Mycobacteroides abscessus TaxID=36809 RepID=UPI000E678532|nr:hypothetical protein [Mycobacteroides abscessus]RIS72888.1 hypothetical protein D2E70_08530 [Mycobacteroides abscessus]